jgi:hypothetical protein
MKEWQLRPDAASAPPHRHHSAVRPSRRTSAIDGIGPKLPINYAVLRDAGLPKAATQPRFRHSANICGGRGKLCLPEGTDACVASFALLGLDRLAPCRRKSGALTG